MQLSDGGVRANNIFSQSTSSFQKRHNPNHNQIEKKNRYVDPLLQFFSPSLKNEMILPVPKYLNLQFPSNPWPIVSL